MFLRRLNDVTKKTSFLICFSEVSQRHLIPAGKYWQQLNLFASFPVDTKTSLQLVAMSLSNVALTSPYNCDGNIGQRCKNDVVATSHKETSWWDVATTSFLQRHLTFPLQLCGNFRATSDSDDVMTLYRCFVLWKANIDNEIVLLPKIHFILKLFYN